MKLETWIEKHLSYKRGYYTKITSITAYYKRTHHDSKMSMSELKVRIKDKFGTSGTNNHIFQDKKGNKVKRKNLIPVVINKDKYDFVDRYAKEYKLSERAKKMEMIEAYVADYSFKGNQITLLGVNQHGEVLGRFVIPFVKTRLFEELQIKGTSIIGEKLVFRGSRMDNENYLRVSELYSTQQENDNFSLTLQNIYANLELNQEQRKQVQIMENAKELYAGTFQATKYVKNPKVKKEALASNSEYFLSDIGFIETLDNAELKNFLNKAGLITKVKGSNFIKLNLEHPEMYVHFGTVSYKNRDGKQGTKKVQKFTELFKQLFLQAVEEYRQYFARNSAGN